MVGHDQQLITGHQPEDAPDLTPSRPLFRRRRLGRKMVQMLFDFCK